MSNDIFILISSIIFLSNCWIIVNIASSVTVRLEIIKMGIIIIITIAIIIIIQLLTTVHAVGRSFISIPLVAKATDAHKMAAVSTLPSFSSTTMLTSISSFGNVSYKTTTIKLIRNNNNNNVRS